MNNQKRVLGHFKWIPILLCIVPLFVTSWASIPYDEVKFKMFDGNDSNVQTELLKSLQTTQNIFARSDVKKAISAGLAIGVFVETWAPALNLLFIVTNLLAHESDWRASFTKTLANELHRETALGHVQLMQATMDTINEKFELMNDGHPKGLRISIARFIHRELNKMLNLFARSDAFVKTYPLVGGPLLITIAQFVALFDPMAKVLIKREAMARELSCKMATILLDYRPRLVDARFEKLHEDSTKGLVEYTNLLRPLLSNSYNQTGTPDTFDCAEKACDGSRRLCMKDDFGISWHAIDLKCARNYISILRYRIEEMVPVDLLNGLCVNKPQATGNLEHILIRRLTIE